MLRTIMDALVWLLTKGKDFMFGDVSWDTLFFINIATWGLLLYLAARFTKTYNAGELKQKWLGLGHVLHGVYSARNWMLRVGSTLALVFLYMSGVTAGSSRNGVIADCGSPLTNTPTGFYKITDPNEERGVDGEMKKIIYVRRIDVNGNVEPTGNMYKVGMGEMAMNTSLEPGQNIDVALSHGGTWISNVSDQQLAMKLEKERKTAKTFFANLFSPITNFFRGTT